MSCEAKVFFDGREVGEFISVNYKSDEVVRLPLPTETMCFREPLIMNRSEQVAVASLLGLCLTKKARPQGSYPELTLTPTPTMKKKARYIRGKTYEVRKKKSR